MHVSRAALPAVCTDGTRTSRNYGRLCTERFGAGRRNIAVSSRPLDHHSQGRDVYAQTKTPRSAPCCEGAGEPQAPGSREEHKTAVARTTELSEEVLQRLEAGQRAAIEAVTEFIDTVDRTLPHGEGASKRQTVVDAAMKMADRLVHTQYDFLRKVVHDAGKSLSRSETDKK